MITKELLAYIEEAFKEGFEREEIKEVLLRANWRAEDIRDAFALVAEKTKPANVSNSSSATAEGAPAPVVLPKIFAEEGGRSAIFSDAKPKEAVAAKSDPREAVPKKTRWLLPIVAGLAIALIAAGGVGFAYTKNIWPFVGAKYDAETLVRELLKKISSIQSASYAVTLSLEDKPRDADAKPLNVAIPPLPPEEQARYDRDKTRFDHLLAIDEALDKHLAAKKRYPKTLKEANAGAEDPATGESYEYAAGTDGKSYALKIAFETPEALAVLREDASPPAIEGTAATFTEKSNRFLAFQFTGKPAQPLLVEFFGNQEKYLNVLPAEIGITFKASGETATQGAQSTDARFALGADIQFGDLAANADAEFLKKDEAYYIRINKFPSLFFDASSIKEKWVKIVPGDFAGSGELPFLHFDASKFIEEERVKGASLLEQITLILRISEEESAFLVTPKGKDAFEGKPVYRYTLALQKEKLPAFYKRLTDEFTKAFGKKSFFSFDERTAQYLVSSSFEDVFNYFQNNGSFELTTDVKTGDPVRLAYTFRLVPSETAAKLKEKQFFLSAALSFKDINAVPAIQEPAEAMTFNEAAALLSGVSAEEWLFEKQTKNISRIRQALDTHKKLSGNYPDALSALEARGVDIVKMAGAPAIPENTYLATYYANRKLIERVPNDAFAENPFPYVKTDAGYLLRYTVKLPPFRKEGKVFFGNTYRIGSDPKRNPSKLIAQYVEGVNTATEKILSQEAETQSNTDADKDGISDTLEIYLGTDKNKRDTDGDGKTDFTELKARENPTGAGTLE